MENVEEYSSAGPTSDNAMLDNSADAATDDNTVTVSRARTTKRRRKRSVAKNRLSKKDRKAVYVAQVAAGQLKKASPVSSGNTPPGAPKPVSMPDPPGEKSDEQPPSAGFSETKNAYIVDDSGALRLAADLLVTLPPHIWWRSLLDLDSGVDLSLGTQKEWAVIMPVMIKSGLFKVPPIGIKHTKLEFDTSRWDDLTQVLSTVYHVRLEYTETQRRNETRSYFIILNGSPMLGSPLRQMATVSEKGLEALNIPSLIGVCGNTRMSRCNDAPMTERLYEFQRKYRNEFLAFYSERLPAEDSSVIGQYIQDLKQAEIQERVKARLAAEKGTAEVQVRLLATVERSIRAAEALELDVTPRVKRNGDGTIEMHTRKQFSGMERCMAVSLVKLWGYEHPSLLFREKMRIASAAGKLIAYDYGFSKHVGCNSYSVRRWCKSLATGVKSGTTRPLDAAHGAKQGISDKIEEDHPGYLHELYRYATSTIGLKASFDELTQTMNEKSNSPIESRPELNLHPRTVHRWWKKNNGSEKSPFEKPRLTTKHMADRVSWVETWGGRFLDIKFPVCYLDEKWFYTSTRRKKLKHLPRHKNEPIGVDVLKRPKCRSRRFPIKIMYLGVVGRPR